MNSNYDIRIEEEGSDIDLMVYRCKECRVEIVEDTDEWDNADWRNLLDDGIVLCCECKSPDIPTEVCCRRCEKVVMWEQGGGEEWMEADWKDFEIDGMVLCMDCPNQTNENSRAE